jgi:hypothetical protein
MLLQKRFPPLPWTNKHKQQSFANFGVNFGAVELRAKGNQMTKENSDLFKSNTIHLVLNKSSQDGTICLIFFGNWKLLLVMQNNCQRF